MLFLVGVLLFLVGSYEMVVCCALLVVVGSSCCWSLLLLDVVVVGRRCCWMSLLLDGVVFAWWVGWFIVVFVICGVLFGVVVVIVSGCSSLVARCLLCVGCGYWWCMLLIVADAICWSCFFVRRLLLV